MSCVLLSSAIIRVAKQHISVWRAVVAVLLLGLIVVAGCDDVRPFCDLAGSCSSDGTDDGGNGGEDDCINRIGQENTIELRSTPEEIDVRVGQTTDVLVEVVNPVAGRTYSFTTLKEPTNGQLTRNDESRDPDLGRITFTFLARTSTGFSNDTMEVGVKDSASEEGCRDITIKVQQAVTSSSRGTAMGGRDSISK